MSGFLDENVFSDEMIYDAIDFVEALSPYAAGAYIPHNIVKMKMVGSIEYNGEF